MGIIHAPILLVLVSIGIVSIADYRLFKIYNVVALPLLVCGLVHHAVVTGAGGVSDVLLGIGFGLGILATLSLIAYPHLLHRRGGWR